jgi:hypothetical protein
VSARLEQAGTARLTAGSLKLIAAVVSSRMVAATVNTAAASATE